MTSEYYLYIVETTDRLTIKVGISSNPTKRMKHIIVNSAKPVRLAHIELIGSKEQAEAYEAEIHRKLKARGLHSHGEWFNCSSTFAVMDMGEPWPFSRWPRGTAFRPPPMVTEVPLPDAVVQEDLEFVRSNISVPSQK